MTLMPTFRPSRRAVLASAAGSIVASNAVARRAIPDNNLVYPVMITLTLKNGLKSFGSGFYFNAPDGVYLVTAKHVLFPPPAKILPDAEIELISYSNIIAQQNRITITASLFILNANGNIKAHQSRDVAVIKIATFNALSPDANTSNTPPDTPTPKPSPNTPVLRRVTYVSDISVNAPADGVIVGVAKEGMKTYDQVLVGNEVIVYGYPRSLIASNSEQQLDPLRPLLRRGLIAGFNESTRRIILDCPVYRGNSGGPAVEVEPEGFGLKLAIIGVVVEFIPLKEGSEDFFLQFNSGYSVVEPMDFVLELIQ